MSLWPDPTSSTLAMVDAAAIVGNDDGRGVGYPGGKSGSGVWQRIISQMPPHRVYVEPFLGHGAVMRHKRPADFDIGIDLSQAAIDWWRKRAVTHPRSPVVAQGDGMRWLREMLTAGIVDASWLIYADPPYLAATRTRLFYDHELATEGEHVKLLMLLIDLAEAGANVLISGYWSHLYALLLGRDAGWREIRYETMTRGGLRWEYLWCSFAAPAELHDCRFVGSSFRERERIKRKRQRWTSRFMAMGPGERQVIREALAAAEGQGGEQCGSI